MSDINQELAKAIFDDIIVEDGVIDNHSSLIDNLPKDIIPEQFNKSVNYIGEFTGASAAAVEAYAQANDLDNISATFHAGDNEHLAVEHLVNKNEDDDETNYSRTSMVGHVFDWSGENISSCVSDLVGQTDDDDIVDADVEEESEED